MNKTLLALILVATILSLLPTETMANASILVHKIYSDYPIGKAIGVIDVDNDGYKEVISCTYTGHGNKTAIILIDFELNKTQELGILPRTQKCIEAFKVNKTLSSIILNNKSAITILIYDIRDNKVSTKVLSNKTLEKILNESLVIASSIGDYDRDEINETLLHLVESKLLSLKNYIIYIDPIEGSYKIYEASKIIENISKNAKYCFTKKAIPVNTLQNYQKITILLLCNPPSSNRILVVNAYVKDYELHVDKIMDFDATSLDLRIVLEAGMVVVNSKPLVLFYGMDGEGVKVVALWENKSYVLNLDEIGIHEVMLSAIVEKKGSTPLNNNTIILGRILEDPGVIVIDLNNKVVKTYLFPQNYRDYLVSLNDIGNVDNINGKDYIAIALSMSEGKLKVLYMDLVTLDVTQIFEADINEIENYGGGLISDIDNDNITEVAVSVKDKDKGYMLYLLDQASAPRGDKGVYWYEVSMIALILVIILTVYLVLKRRHH